MFKYRRGSLFFDTSLVKGRISLIVLLSTLGKRTLMICICNNTAGLLRVQPCLCTVAVRNYSGKFVFGKGHTNKTIENNHIKEELPKLLDRIIVIKLWSAINLMTTTLRHWCFYHKNHVLFIGYCKQHLVEGILFLEPSI